MATSEENDQERINKLAMEYYNQGVIAHEKKLFDRATLEYKKAVECNPAPEALMLILSNYAMTIWLKNGFDKRNGADISDEEYEDVKKVLLIYQQIISVYEKLSDDSIISCELPLREIYDTAKNNLSAFALYGCAQRDTNGKYHMRKDENSKTVNQNEKKGCFIATAAYETNLAEEVICLQKFRDTILCKSFWGRMFIVIYYCISPWLAYIISLSAVLRLITRNYILKPIVYIVRQF